MGLWMRLWWDEGGAVMTAELALLGTVGVLGGVVGLNVMARSVNEELTDVAHAFRSLDQSYAYKGTRSCGAHVAGSSFQQEDVEKSLADLCGIDDEKPRGHHHHGDHDDRRWDREGKGHHEHGERGHDDHGARRGDARPRLVPERRRPEGKRPQGRPEGERGKPRRPDVRRPTSTPEDLEIPVRTRIPARQQV